MTESAAHLHLLHPADIDAGMSTARHDPPSTDAPASPGQRANFWTADQLMATQFPAPRWAVPGLLAEGVSLLAGPPKVGKSWLSLGLALSVAGAGEALDAIPTEHGDVLYLALEDTPRRLKTRMAKLLGTTPAPARLSIATTWPPLTNGGDAWISTWLDKNPDARLIVIDVLARIRGTTPPGLSAYDADYAAITGIKRIADTRGVAVVLVHHVRKMGSEDFLTEVSGTNGLAGASDAVLVLKRSRGEADGVLHITGRDVDEAEYALRFIPAAGAWVLLDGPPEDHTLPKTRATILRYLRDHPGATPKGIADATGLGYDNTKRTAARMAADGQLTADHTGRYRPAGPPGMPADTQGHTSAVPPVPAVPQPTPTSMDTGNDACPPAVPAVPPTMNGDER